MKAGNYCWIFPVFLAVSQAAPSLAVENRLARFHRDHIDRITHRREIRRSAARNMLVRPVFRAGLEQQNLLVSIPRAQLPFVSISTQNTEEPFEFSYLLDQDTQGQAQMPKIMPVKGAAILARPVARQQDGQLTKVSMHQGSMLVANGTPVNMTTKYGAVSIAAGTTAYVIQHGNELAVYNLDSRGPSDLKIQLGARHVHVPTGRVVLLSAAAPQQYQDTSLSKYIVSENPVAVGRYGDVHVFSAEFSYISALDNCPQFAQMLNSSVPQQKKAANKLLKLAAIMSF